MAEANRDKERDKAKDKELHNAATEAWSKKIGWCRYFF